MPENNTGASWSTSLPWDVKRQYEEEVARKTAMYQADNDQRREAIAVATKRQETGLEAADKQLTAKYDEWGRNVDGVLARYNGKPQRSLDGARELQEAMRPFANNPILVNAAKTKQNYEYLMADVRSNKILHSQYKAEKEKYDKLASTGNFEKESYEYVGYDNKSASDRYMDVATAGYKETVIDNGYKSVTGYTDAQLKAIRADFMMIPENAETMNDLVTHELTAFGVDLNKLDEKGKKAEYDKMEWKLLREHFFPLKTNVTGGTGSTKSAENPWTNISAANALPSDTNSIAKLAKVGSNNVLPGGDLGFGASKSQYAIKDFTGKFVLVNAKRTVPGANVGVGEVVTTTQDLANNYIRQIDEAFAEAGITNGWSIKVPKHTGDGNVQDVDLIDNAAKRKQFGNALKALRLDGVIDIDSFAQEWAAGKYSNFGDVNVNGKVYPGKSSTLNGTSLLYYMMQQVATPYSRGADMSGVVERALSGVEGYDAPNGLVMFQDAHFWLDVDASSKKEANSTDAGQTQQTRQAYLNNIKDGTDDVVSHGGVPGVGSFNQRMSPQGEIRDYAIIDNTDKTVKTIPIQDVFRSQDFQPFVLNAMENIRGEGTVPIPTNLSPQDRKKFRAGNAMSKYLRVVPGSAKALEQSKAMFGEWKAGEPLYDYVQKINATGTDDQKKQAKQLVADYNATRTTP